MNLFIDVIHLFTYFFIYFFQLFTYFSFIRYSYLSGIKVLKYPGSITSVAISVKRQSSGLWYLPEYW